VYHKFTLPYPSRRPIIVGGSVIGLPFDGGIMIASDTMCSRGTQAKFKGVKRISKINDELLMASTGDYSDYVHISERL